MQYWCFAWFYPFKRPAEHFSDHIKKGPARGLNSNNLTVE
ncbi:hypothetical protein PCPL58_3698 [Pseudomonas cerasi]|uniref:Uncharacterized protein n=1 Tax=Pseudomonas cerasi TaxID=1583341 RepID=A0A193SSV3_9PSED|nr:hypothetical protein PCPL58_3698 [Pseudomonas cerasi]SOS21875.1 hypothetical protein PL963_03788 [Pseudomonas cerasi]